MYVRGYLQGSEDGRVVTIDVAMWEIWGKPITGYMWVALCDDEYTAIW